MPIFLHCTKGSKSINNTQNIPKVDHVFLFPRVVVAMVTAERVCKNDHNSLALVSLPRIQSSLVSDSVTSSCRSVTLFIIRL